MAGRFDFSLDSAYYSARAEGPVHPGVGARQPVEPAVEISRDLRDFKVGWTVTGTVTLSGSPLAGVTFTASNGGTCDTSNASGVYTCIVPAGWSGTVIPSSTTYGFVPASRSYSNVTSAKTAQNFTAAPLQSHISGVVTASGAPLPGVAFSATLGAVCTSSDASGQYTCGMLDGWSGTITPSLAGYVFDPQSRVYSNVTTAQPAQDYLAVVSVNISGTVTNAGAALPGVALAASSGGACSASDSSGQYTCVVPTGWSGTVTPSLTSYVFTPASRAYSGMTTDQTAQDYAGVEFFQLSGTITASGSPLAGVLLTATGGTCTQTNASGQYTCSVAEGSTGTVIPAASGYLFVPAARSYGNLSAPQAGNDFAGTLVGTSAPITYIHADHLNTPRLVANAAGQTVWLWHQTEPFGNTIPDENPSGLGTFDLPLRFPGQSYDAEAGLHYNYFRNYHPGIGRYSESDPIGLAGGPNTYAYVDADPIRLADPLGLEPSNVITEAWAMCVRRCIADSRARNDAAYRALASFGASPPNSGKTEFRCWIECSGGATFSRIVQCWVVQPPPPEHFGTPSFVTGDHGIASRAPRLGETKKPKRRPSEPEPAPKSPPPPENEGDL